MKAIFPYGVLLIALTACEKSISEQQKEAQEAQREADEKAARTIDDTRQKIDEARYESGREQGAVNQDLRDKENELALSGNDKIRRVQESAAAEAQDVSEALRKAGADLRESVEKQLNDIDKRASTAREALSKKTGDVKIRSEKTLNDVRQHTQSVREDLKDFESRTVQSIEAFAKQLTDRLNELSKSIEKVESES